MLIRNIHMSFVGWTFFAIFSVFVTLGLPLYLVLTIAGIIKIVYTGFSSPSMIFLAVFYLNILFLLGFISSAIPAFRKIYYVFPWLTPFVKVLSIDAIVLLISFWLISKGFETSVQAIHIRYIGATILIFVLCRFLQCLYFKHRQPFALGGRDE